MKLSSAGTIEWQKTLGGTSNESANSIRQTSDGGYITAGITTSNNGDVTGYHGNNDAWVVKLSSNGSLEWQKALGGTSSDDIKSIDKTTDGGYVMAGSTLSNNGDVSGNHGNYDFWVVKLSSSGTLQWQKALGGTNEDKARNLKQTTDGGYILLGYIYSNNGNVTGFHGSTVYSDIWVVKLSSNGTLEWQKAIGGTNIDDAYGIEQVADGGYIMSSYTYSIDGDVTNNRGFSDAWIVKLSNTGILQWQKTLGGAYNDTATSVHQTSEGGYIVSCYTNSIDGDVTDNHGGSEYWVVKLGPEALGTSTYATNQIKLVPNPTNSQLTLENTTNLTFDKIIVTDLAGKTLLKQEQSSNQINVVKLSGGVYILQAFSGENKVIFKFLKE